MCLLSFFKPGITPDLTALAAGAQINPHGHGYAVIAHDRILIGHGLDPEEVNDEFAAVRARFPDTPALFHSRLATHGPITTGNCHPFIVGGDQRTVLAHNGTLPATVHPGAGDARSDTRIAAEEFLPREPFGPLDSWSGRSGLETWLRTDKMVLLTVDPAYRHNAYLFNEHHGHLSDEGIWYSNTSYRWALPTSWSSTSAPDEYGDGERYCVWCGEFDPDRTAGRCLRCGACQNCLREFPHCRCLGPHDQVRNMGLRLCPAPAIV